MDTKIKDHFDEEAWDEVEENALLDEIRNIIKMIAGKPKSGWLRRFLVFVSLHSICTHLYTDTKWRKDVGKYSQSLLIGQSFKPQ